MVRDISENGTVYDCSVKVSMKEINNNKQSAEGKNIIDGDIISASRYVYCTALENNVA